MNTSGIEFLNILGSADLNSPVADPEYLGFMHSNSSIDVLVHGYKRDVSKGNYPTLLETSRGTLEMYYPDENLEACKQNNGLIAKYGIYDTNLIVNMKYL